MVVVMVLVFLVVFSLAMGGLSVLQHFGRLHYNQEVRNVSSRKKAEMELAEARNLLTNLLTPREKEILKMMVNGSTTKEIAYDLEISPRTVEAHRQNMMSKLQVVDMPMLVRCAVTHRLVPLE